MEAIADGTFDGRPVIPDGPRQTSLQWNFTEQVCKRELQHPEEWAGRTTACALESQSHSALQDRR